MKNFFLLTAVLINSMLMAQGGMNLGCTNCALENRWQSNQFIDWNNGVIEYTQNTTGSYPSSQVWEFEHVSNEPANIFKIKNSSGYIVRTVSGVTVQNNPPVEEDTHWELLVRNGFYFLLAPCELKGMHIENLTGNVQYGNINLGWHSAQWVLKDANGASAKTSKTVTPPHLPSPTIGFKTLSGDKDLLISQLKKGNKQTTSIQLSKSLALNLKVNMTKKVNDSLTLFGGVSSENPNFTFQLYEHNNHLEGTIINASHHRAFKIKESGGQIISEEVDIDEVMCVDVPKGSHNGPVTNMLTRGCDIPANTDVYALNSLPGTTSVIYLDFDGEYVVHPWWNGGNPIDAQPMELSDGWIYTIWQGIVEDFLPFNVTVTTDSNVYNAAPLGQKTQVIFTTTNFTTYGGVAYYNTFNNTSVEVPCWVFNDFSPQGIWDTGSHEIGHTLGLSHDGRTSPSEVYYAGHEDWGPIMGVSWDRQMAQWSIGEYQNANNTEDDIAIITKPANHITFRTDDIPTTKALGVTTVNSTTKSVDDGGIIEQSTDVDQFTFTITETSELHLHITPASIGPNLNIGVRILNGTTQVASFNPDGPENNFSIALSPGSYILEIDGVGERNPLTDGYSDYASIGQYNISGTIEAGNTTDLLTIYNVPSSSAIPTGFRQYSYIHTIGSGGPDLSNVFNSVFNWWGNSSNPNGLYQFTLETTNGSPRYYTNIPDYGSYTLHTSSPEITINSSIGFSGLDGNYWATLDGSNLVLVEKTGQYALYFSNSATPPTIPGVKKGQANSVTYDLLSYPNPFTNTVSIVIPEEMGQCEIKVADMQGFVIEKLNASGEITLGNNYKSGIYNISVSGNNMIKQLKVVKY